MLRATFVILIVAQTLCLTAFGEIDLKDPASRAAVQIFRTIAGMSPPLNDSRLALMADYIRQNQLLRAAQVPVESNEFYDVTLLHWASQMSTRDEFQSTRLNDFIATIVGHTVQGGDARELLTMNARYEGRADLGLPQHRESYNLGTNDLELGLSTYQEHYKALEQLGVPLRDALVRVSPQRPGVPAAGLLTTTSWAFEHLQGGTNRRAVEYAFREFMCVPFTQVSDASVPLYRIRQDVDRRPGGDPEAFTKRCASCHGILDGMSGAFAQYNFYSRRSLNEIAFEYKTDVRTDSSGPDFVAVGSYGIAKKFLRNEEVMPWSEGSWRTVDDSWVNFAVDNQNEKFGWRGNLEGRGVTDFGRMIANSAGFSSCMAKRVYSQLCLKKDFHPDKINDKDYEHLNAAKDEIELLAQTFEKDGYSLKNLFARAAITPKCLDAQ